MKSDNELIEQFWISQGGKPNLKADLSFYESDWSMLIPVWHKFRTLQFGKFAQPSFNNYCARIAHCIAYEDIHNLYFKLCLGIKWYNETQSKC